jgi:hypothetical protein
MKEEIWCIYGDVVGRIVGRDKKGYLIFVSTNQTQVKRVSESEIEILSPLALRQEAKHVD